MASLSPTPIDALAPMSCPLCHTVEKTVTSDTLVAGATWKCTTCGQRWSATRLATVAAYAQYVATH